MKLDDSTNCIMDTITTSPELQHISEDIFKLLDNKSLMNCRLTNSSWKNILNQPIFWLQRLETEGWESLSKLIGNRQLAQDFARELKNLESLPLDVQYKWRAISQDLEIYVNISWIRPIVGQQPKEFVLILINIYNNRQRLLPLKAVALLEKSNRYVDLVKSILEHENPCSQVTMKVTMRIYGDYFLENATSIHLAAFYGFTGVVEKLSKKYDDPLVKDKNGSNAIHFAALNGSLNIVKHLIHNAVFNRKENKLDTIKFLVSLTNTLNAPNNFGWTPIEIAKTCGNVRVQRFLEDYCHWRQSEVKTTSATSGIRGDSKGLYFGASNICTYFRGGTANQPVPWHGGTG